MKVRIVYHKDSYLWILGKFDKKLNENLKLLGVEVELGLDFDPTADINHLIPCDVLDCSTFNKGITTLMVTHVDDSNKLNYLLRQNNYASVFICMSEEHMIKLAQLGVDHHKLCYINPAHDGIMPIKKISIGWSCRVQDDGRKREYFVDKFAEKLDPSYFHFKIMGDGWDKQVDILRKKGFEVDYTNNFIYQEYPKFISGLDYYLYMGMDEGQMGFVDALAAGIKTIVTKQGYHLDAPNGITHSFTEYDELERILLQLETEKRLLVESVKDWTWLDYAKKHVELWSYLLDSKKNKSNYIDGLNSFIKMNNTSFEKDEKYQKSTLKKLKREKLKHKYFHYKILYSDIYRKSGVWGIVKRLLRKLK
jgi:hypothetical protein